MFKCPHCRKSIEIHPVEIIPLGAAVWCADCDNVTRSSHHHCAACGSGAVINLASLLGRRLEGCATADMLFPADNGPAGHEYIEN
jgi:hypothetical protein